MNPKPIQADDVIFNHKGIDLVFAIRFVEDNTIDAIVGDKVTETQFDAKLFVSADTSGLEAGAESMRDFINGRVLPLMNEKIEQQYGAFDDGAEFELWQKVARFCKENLVYNSSKGLYLI